MCIAHAWSAILTSCLGLAAFALASAALVAADGVNLFGGGSWSIEVGRGSIEGGETLKEIAL